jgi:dihydroneopterin aldolase
MNRIFIHDLRLSTRIGALAPEREAPQPLRLDLELGLASDEAFRSDRLADTIDYAAVVRQVCRFADEHRFHLLERFAEGIADLVLATFPACCVKVRVAKLGAIPGVREIGITIERRRPAAR